MCWAFPESQVINTLFGSNMGLGMGVITLDWSQISLIGNPLVIPWWAQCNIVAGFVLFYWIIVPVIYYTNVRQHGFVFPIKSADLVFRLGILAIFQSIRK